MSGGATVPDGVTRRPAEGHDPAVDLVPVGLMPVDLVPVDLADPVALAALAHRLARAEVRRRGLVTSLGHHDAEALAEGAAATAVRVLLEESWGYSGQSRVTTWVAKYVVREVSRAVARREAGRRAR